MDNDTDICADCSALSPQWASVTRGVLLCDECSAIHRQLGRHISQIKHLKKSRWRSTQLDMVHYLSSACANRYWEHVLYEPMLAGQHSVHPANIANHRDSKQHQPASLTARPKRKPTPTDPIYPNKADFIREKYMFLGFFKKPRNISQEDLNQQLHASVRTNVLETSLYLLALGADVNFVHLNKGTSPLHVACQYGQLGQVELLLAYGADLCARDSRGLTPLDVALEKSLMASEATGLCPPGQLTHEQKLFYAWSPLVNTLVNAYYEVSDCFSYFLSRRVPNHRTALLGISSKCNSPVLPRRAACPQDITGPLDESRAVINGHFLISSSLFLSSAGTGTGASNPDAWIHEARRRLGQLPTVSFEDLCLDVYDEVDRRLTNSFLECLNSKINGKQSNGLSHSLANGDSKQSVATKTSPSEASRSLTLFFLPPNTSYTSVRNQARQKLGRLSTGEFHTLVLDILSEISIRLLPLFPPSKATSRSISIHARSAYHPTNTDDDPISVSSCLAPLPSPPIDVVCPESSSPVDEPDSLQAFDQSATRTLEGIQQEHSIGGLESPPIDSKRGNRTKRDLDDPVYDQVAIDVDAASILQSNGHSIERGLNGEPAHADANDPNSAILANDSSNGGHNSRTSLVETFEESTSVHRSLSGSLLESSVSDQLSRSTTSITVQPGHVLGSKRLHLSHTGRVVQHRASVPSITHPALQLSAIGLSPIIESANLALKPPVQTTGTTMTSPTTDLPITTVPSVSLNDLLSDSGTRRQRPFIDSCCVASRNEITRLRKENSDLNHQLNETEESKRLAETRLEQLEEEMKNMSATISKLEEDNSALLAAFSAGMVMTHSSPNAAAGTNTSDSHRPEGEHKSPSVGLPTHFKFDEPVDRKMDDCVEEQYEDEYKPERLLAKRNDSGNYAIGSQCIDSGIMLRQGILRSTPCNFESPPAHTSTVSTPIAPRTNSPLINSKINMQFHPPPVAVQSQLYVSNPSSPPLSGPSSPYVNVTQAPPVHMPRKFEGHVPLSAPVATSAHMNFVSVNALESHAYTASDPSIEDYTSPNATGSPSPAPILLNASERIASEQPNMTVCATAGVQISRSPSNASRSHLHMQSDLHKQHAHILASIATLPEYDVPQQSTPSYQVKPGMKAMATKATEPWSNANSDRVIHHVELLSSRIRTLVELAKTNRFQDCVNCALTIHATVQDIVSLFPPVTRCSPNVSSTLCDLASVSLNLRPRCEQMSRNLITLPPGYRNQSASCTDEAQTSALASDVSALIRYAHQIAKAAKELLSLVKRA